MNKCEQCDNTDGVTWYEWPVQDDISGGGIFACDTHAVENGFCPICGYFVLGVGNDVLFAARGCCPECYEEICIESGEYGEYKDADPNEFALWDYDTWEDIYTGESGGRYIGPGSDTLPEDSE